jgi:hypothetical protein
MNLIAETHGHKHFINHLKKEGKIKYFNLGPRSEEEWFKILEVLEKMRYVDEKLLENIIKRLETDKNESNTETIDCLKRLKEATKLMKEDY